MVVDRKHQILGGVKVSSRQLAKWGQMGGRLQKYPSVAEKQKAYRLRKKQVINPDYQSRTWRSYEEVINEGRASVSSYHYQCDNCGSKIISADGGQCQSCYQGNYYKDTMIIKRAMTGAERVRAYRARIKKLEDEIDRREED